MGACIFIKPQKEERLYTALFALNRPHIIAFVGAGGKTTAITKLGWELKNAGHTVLITTTTHMSPPKKRKLLGESLSEAKKILSDQGMAWAGKPIGEEKIAPVDGPVSEMASLAEYVLVEADGAKGHPLKMIDAAYEPVIPDASQAVVAVAGLKGLGRPLSEVVHRPKLAMKILHVSPDHLVTPEDIARLLTVSYDPAYVLLNQADTAKLREAADKISLLLPKARVLAASLKDWKDGET